MVAVDLRHYTPEQFADMIVVKLAELAITPSPAMSGAGRGPAGGVRVAAADPRRLRVHTAISVPGMPDEVPPEYVQRDVDVAEHGIRTQVRRLLPRMGLANVAQHACGSGSPAA